MRYTMEGEGKRNVNICLHISQLLIYTISADILLSEFAFVIDRAISWYTLPLGFLVGLLCLVYFYGDKPGWRIIGEVSVAIFLFLLLAGISGKFLDFTYDGNHYHKVAIGLLKNHWNPLYQTSASVMGEVLGTPHGGNLWVECYAKGAWIFGSGIYSLTGNIECGKAYTLISMSIAFLLTYYCVRSYSKGVLFALTFSLAAAMNPVAVQQMTSFYVDGYLHMMLYTLVLSLAWLAKGGEEKAERQIFGSIVACTMVICGTIKFTGLLYGGVYCIIYFLYYCYLRLRTKDSAGGEIRRCFFQFALLAGTTVLWAGADCYVMNMLRYSSPLYPLYGKGAIDIMTTNSPFEEVNRVKNLLTSLFSKASNSINSLGSPPPELKVPFTVDWSTESIIATGVDCRVSGFGVLFSGIFIIAVAAIIVKIRRRGKREKVPFWMLLFGTNLGLCLGITESWWARYAPYIWFTVLLGFFIILERKFAAPHVERWGKSILCVIVLSNSLICL